MEKEKKGMSYEMSDNVKLYRAIEPNITTVEKNIVSFNADQDDNAYPDKLIDLYKNASATHSNFIRLKKNMLAGDGVVAVNEDIPTTDFIDKRNRKGENLNDIDKKVNFDLSLFEAFALQVIYDSDGNIADVYHTDVSTVRAEKPDDLGVIKQYYISKNWGQISNKNDVEKVKATPIKAYNPATGKADGRQLMYVNTYIAGNDVYAIPSYNSATNWIQLDNKLAIYELNKVSSGFLATTIISLPGDPDDETKKSFRREFERKYVGVDKAKVIYIWGANADQKPEMVRLDEEDGSLFDQLISITSEQIAIAHGGSKELAGIDSKGVSLGGDANKLSVGLAFYQKNVIEPLQTMKVDAYNKLIEINKLGKVDIGYTPLNVIIEEGNNPEEELENEKKVAIKELITELDLNK